MNRSGLKQGFRLGILAAILAAAAGLHPGHAAQAQSTPALRCVFSASSVQAGSTVELRIELQGVTDLYGYQAELRFPAGTLQFTDGDPARTGTNLSLGTLLSPDFVAQNEVNAGLGEALLAVTQLEPSQPRSGSGTLARAQVQPLTPGTLNVQLVNVILADSQAAPMPHDLSGCSILVTGQPLPTLTPGPTRTQAPTEANQPTSAAGQATATTPAGGIATVTPGTPLAGTPDSAAGSPAAVSPMPVDPQASPGLTEPTATLAFNTQAAGEVTPQGTQVAVPLVSGGGGTAEPGAEVDQPASRAGGTVLRVVIGLAAVVGLYFILRRRALPQ